MEREREREREIIYLSFAIRNPMARNSGLVEQTSSNWLGKSRI